MGGPAAAISLRRVIFERRRRDADGNAAVAFEMKLRDLFAPKEGEMSNGGDTESWMKS